MRYVVVAAYLTLANFFWAWVFGHPDLAWQRSLFQGGALLMMFFVNQFMDKEL